ncbi:hypothetical protein AB0A05_07185 [Streptomyces sp. NPDC046374]|uniref:hypothetical protein n=1 Tax=Streptomyces sp. NPDC046374 TaxID=3154917 RepID=UPI0033E62B81
MTPVLETGVPALDTALVWGGVITLLAGAGTAAWRVARTGVRLGRRVDQFMDDWYGEEARPGVPGRPGVMERMGGIEDRIGRVEHELYPNSGGSLRDAVDQANERLARLCPDEPGEEDCPPPTASAGQ